MKKVPSVKNRTSEALFVEGKGLQRPWDEGDERIIKSFNLRLPEPLHMMLHFIAENTPNSIHSFIMEGVEAAVEKALEDMIGK